MGIPRSGARARVRSVVVGLAAAGIAGVGAVTAGAGITGTTAAAAAGKAHPSLTKVEAHTKKSRHARDVKGAAATVHATTVAGVGKVLADTSGYTVYLFTPDKQSKPTCSGSCASVWHPLTVAGKPVAGEGVKASLLGTVRGAGGKTQVTYDKWPLYTFTLDAKPGEATGQGVKSFGGQWWAVTPAGKKAGSAGTSTSAKSSARSSASKRASSSKGSSGSSGSSGYGGY